MLQRTTSCRGRELISMTDRIVKRHSFSGGGDIFFLKKIKKINISNASLCLKRISAASNLYRLDKDDFLTYSKKIEFNETTVASNINSKDYVYCGMASTLPINNFGISVDYEGNLVLINGDAYDLFNGLKNKYMSGYKYKIAKITDNKCKIKLDNLYVNKDGLLIGDEKVTGKSYILNITVPSCMSDSNDEEIVINFLDYIKSDGVDNLTFNVDADTALSFSLKNNKIYLKSVLEKGKINDFDRKNSEISVPLKKNEKILSLKRARECLQIETQENKKKRIIYIDPNHISFKKLVARKVSHKPPQIFSSRLGGDPHEKYHTGQPFSSDRKANFSGKYIPSLIDNFRIHVKLSKVRAAEGKNRNAICQIAKAIDPGAEGTFSTISSIVKTKRESCRNKIKNKDDLYCRNLNLLKSNFSQFSKLVNIACEKKCGSDLSKIFLYLIKEIKQKEAIHLSSSQKIAAFFGIASGGIPFFTGWFVGIVGELSIKNHLTISKTENDNIKLSFHNKCKVGAVGLVGTGQGLEKTLLKTSGLDYLTVLPVEANIIMMIQCGFDDDFSFEMTKENFDKFVTQLSNQEEDSEFKKFIISEAEAIQNKETEFVIKIEAKSEVRLQAGRKVNAITYMVMPRTAVGAKLALNLLNVNYASKSRGNKNNEFLLSSKNLKITALKPELDFFADWKVMPIVMQPGQSQKLWCYPLPLLEEAKPIRSLSADGFTLIETAESHKGENTSGNDFFTISRVNKVNKIPMFIKVNEKNDLKNGLNLKKIAKYNNIVDSINEELIKIKRNLICQEVSSQHKLCVINVISHYEYIKSKIDSKERLKDSVESVILSKMEKGNCNKKSFKLKKLEFRKITSLSIVKATIPIPILNFSNVNNIAHDQYLGEIEFLYHKNSDLKPFDAERRINFLY